MSWTKGQFIEAAYEEIGLADYVFDLQPEQLNNALRRLDAMMATWNTRGIRISWPLPLNPDDSTLAQESNAPDTANEAIFLNLAIRIGPTVGKVVSPDTKMLARQAYKQLLRFTGEIPQMQFRENTISGAGNKPYRYTGNTFLPRPCDRLEAGKDSLLNLRSNLDTD